MPESSSDANQVIQTNPDRFSDKPVPHQEILWPPKGVITADDVKKALGFEIAKAFEIPIQNRETISHEMLRDETGSIHDIRFTQGTATATVKEVLSGAYTFIIPEASNHQTSLKKHHFNRRLNVVTMGHSFGNYNIDELIKNDDEYRGILLHESGHAYAEHAHKDEYQAADKTYHDIALRKAVIKEIEKSRQQARRPDFTELIQFIENKRYQYTPEEFEKLIAEFDSYCSDYAALSDLELIPISLYYSRKEAFLWQQLERRAEGDGWIYGLRALGELRSKGINAFNGTADEFNEFLMINLKTHFLVLGFDSPDPDFV